ncbi:MAG: polysaccharide deacetylase family protein [Bacillota bacterium]|uniref:polysaccharide deacetylase family protein n=1 Tax=Cytobacillus firmus TaxID=1399 RepID=UPI00077CDB1F|nr:polysaccharide deacetylase family protein [Cytobacillus firmus]MED4450646.1 polysaccharide deacetylase family protein [Cytobacillus firmus]MED4768756.1 polysaccharide deacetylase family protein [Cytobacillus firmus]
MAIIKKQLILLIICSFLLMPFAGSAVAAADLSPSAFAQENVTMHSGASDQYQAKALISKSKEFIIIGEFTNSLNEHWLRIKYDGETGWIKDTGIRRMDLNAQYFTSSAAKTPIRRGASLSYQHAGDLKHGVMVKIMDTFTREDGEMWVRLSDGNVTGWSRLQDLELFEGTRNYLNKPVFVKTDTQVKRGASSAAKAVYTLKKGKEVTIQSTLINGKEVWHRIADGKRSGWVPGDSVASQVNYSAYMYVKDQSAAIRRGASASYKTVSNLTYGQQVKITSEFVNGSGDIWYKVSAGKGLEGWIPGTSLTSQPMKVAYLTIDDGPTIYSNKLLDTLSQYNAKATFFMVNGNINAYPKAVKRMVTDGHAVGSHSVTHDKNKFYRSPATAVNEMKTTRNTIKKVTGVNSNLIRTPYGSIPYMKQNYRNAMAKEHFIMWDWNVDSMDWKFNSSSYVNYTLHYVDMQEKKGQAPIILIHDRKATVNALPSLLSQLKKRGYVLAPLNESMTPHQFKLK